MKNGKPEELVKRIVGHWLKVQGFHVIPLEAKAIRTFGRNGKAYFKHAGVEPGTSDLVAVGPNGEFCAIELKAKGKLSTLRFKQLLFLEQIIRNNGFGVVVDSAERLETLWSKWLGLDKTSKQDYLFSELPGSLK